MKKLLFPLLLLLTLSLFLLSASAVSLRYDLTCTEEHRVETERDTIITVTFTVTRTDADEPYSVNAMQNYVEFDPDFFEYVSGSGVCTRSNGFTGLRYSSKGPLVHMTDMLDTLPAVCEFGSFQLRVIGSRGESTVRNGSIIANVGANESAALSGEDVTVVIVNPLPEMQECPKDDTCPISAFSDTKIDAWWHDGIHYCLEEGLMIGTGEGMFSPNMTTTRSMIATILWRMADEPKTAHEIAFRDVKPDEWYTSPIRWADKTGVAIGYGNGLFGTNDPITREQLATFLYRFANAEKPASSRALPFDDAGEISDWALDALVWCHENGIVLGKGDGRIDPKGLATRAEAAAMIQRFCKLTGYNG